MDPYATDLTDSQWEMIEPLLPAPKPIGRPRTLDRRKIVDAIFYLLRTGCQWRMLPRDMPRWSTVYVYYRRWRLDGTWFRVHGIHEKLRALVRQTSGRDPCPSAAVLDSQSIRTTEKGGRAATTRPKTSPGASATSWWTPTGCFWPHSSTRAACKTATAPGFCSSACPPCHRAIAWD
jgi:transposase